MAVFTSTRELATQRQTKNFKSQTGWKKHAMALAGYKASGEKNWWGKWVGATPIAKNLAGKHLAEGSDAEEVIASQTGAELKHQMGTASFAASFIGGIGGGGGDTAGSAGGNAAGSSGSGVFSGLGQGGGGPTGQGSWLGNTGASIMGQSGGGGASAFSKGGGEGATGFGKMVGNENMLSGESGKNLTDDIVANGKQKTIEEMSDEAILSMNENEYTKASTEAGQREGGTTGSSSEAKGWKEASDYKGMGSHGLAGQFTNLYAEKMAIADAQKRKAHSMFNQKTTRGTDAYFE